MIEPSFIESSFIEPSNHRFMRVALSLARRNLGQTWPNPSVGAVLVKDGRIVGTGVTAPGGRPHAETEAIAMAGAQAQGASLYVTLEPCCHHGKTPPCTDAIIRAGISHVLVACTDTNPLISGGGIALLRTAGIEVALMGGAIEKEAREINRGFFSVMEKKRPFIALKLATSLDGKIAYPLPNPPPLAREREPQRPLSRAGGGETERGKIRWITSERSRFQAHLLRSQFDAIATGIGTVLADDPELTCRLPGLEKRSPVRVVFDRQGRLPAGSTLAKSTPPVWVMKTALPEAVAELADRGITRLLVEAGAKVSTAFLQTSLVDRIYWFRTPVIIGNDGLAAAGGGFAAELEKLDRWQRLETRILGNDTLEILEKDGSRPALG